MSEFKNQVISVDGHGIESEETVQDTTKNFSPAAAVELIKRKARSLGIPEEGLVCKHEDGKIIVKAAAPNETAKLQLENFVLFVEKQLRHVLGSKA